MEVARAVEKGANIFADAEDAAQRITDDFRDLSEIFESINEAGHIGGLEARALTLECQALALQFKADVYALHARLVKRAQELGIDLPQRDGGR